LSIALKMRPTTLFLLACPAIANIIPRQAPPSITPNPVVLSITATIVDITETLPPPFASIAAVPGCAIRPPYRHLLDSIPRPGGKLRGELTSITDFCAFAPTATVLSVDYSAYTSELVTWYEANSAALGSFQASFTSSCTVAQAAITSAVLACVSKIEDEASAAAASVSGTGLPTTTVSATNATTTVSATNATTTVSGTASTAGAPAPKREGLTAAGAVAGMVALLALL
jgi:hypothetical protein